MQTGKRLQDLCPYRATQDGCTGRMAFSLNTQRYIHYRDRPYTLAPHLSSQCSETKQASLMITLSVRIRSSIPRFSAAPSSPSELLLLCSPKSTPACAPEPRPSHTKCATHTAGATPGQPAVVGALSGPRSRRRHEAGCHGAEALTRPGQAGRRSGGNRRRLTPPPKAVRSPRAGTSSRAQPGRSGAPNAHFPRKEGRGVRSRNPALGFRPARPQPRRPL